MKKFIIACLLSLSSLFSWGQEFQHEIGLRGGLTSGFEYRYFTHETNSVKVLLGTNRGIRLHGLYEFHVPNLFLFTDQLNFYYGFGFHGGFENWDKRFVHENKTWYDNRTAFVMGIDGVVGIEYTFIQTPLSLGMESKPYFDVLGRDMFSFEPFDFAFTVKYLF